MMTEGRQSCLSFWKCSTRPPKVKNEFYFSRTHYIKCLSTVSTLLSPELPTSGLPTSRQFWSWILVKKLILVKTLKLKVWSKYWGRRLVKNMNSLWNELFANTLTRALNPWVCCAHTWYLSQSPRTCPCKFFLAGVNFYRFNAKNWQFTVYFAVITQKNGNLLCILS